MESLNEDHSGDTKENSKKPAGKGAKKPDSKPATNFDEATGEDKEDVQRMLSDLQEEAAIA